MTAVGAGPGSGRSSNLPRAASSFVGRGPALAELARLLEAAALLTITGAGGTGKTRLALEAAGRAVPGYPDGVWLVELAPLADPALVPQAVASALSVGERPGEAPAATLAAALEGRRLLLVLDNCEHLVAACAALVDALLRACPQVRVLATSREPLRVPGETVWRAPPLETPPAGAVAPEALAASEAVRLFVERAAAARPGFALRPENAAAVAEVCRRLDGIPLALELAAARASVLPVGDLLGLLEDRFRLLTGGSRTALPRQQTLAATVDWSYALLTEPERALFARLAVFAGGWSLAAAERVAADPADPAATAGAGGAEGAAGGPGRVPAGGVLEPLTRLVDRSLVLAEEDGEGHARFRMLETLREYALERLVASGEANAVHRRHLAHYTALVEAAAPEVEGPAQRRWLDRLEREHDNCRAALRWVLAHPEPEAVDQGLRLAGALPRFWLTRGHWREALAWLEGLLGLPEAGVPPATRAQALAWAGMLAGTLGDRAAARSRWAEWEALARGTGDPRAVAGSLWLIGRLLVMDGRYPDEAAAVLAQSLALCRQADDQPGLAVSLFALGNLARAQGDLRAARRAFEESAAVYRRLGNRNRAAGALGSLGLTLLDDGDPEGARPLFEEALAIFREMGYENGVAGALRGLGEVARAAGDVERAGALLAQGLAGFRATGQRLSEAQVLRSLALLARATGDAAAAHSRLTEALAIWREQGREDGIAETLETLAGLAAADGEPAHALRLAGAAAAVRDAAAFPLPTPRRAALDARLEPASRALGAAAAAAALAAGRGLTADQALDEALPDRQPRGTNPRIDRAAPAAGDAPPPPAHAPAFPRTGPAGAGGPPGGAGNPGAEAGRDGSESGEEAGAGEGDAAGETGSPPEPLRVDPERYTVWRGGRPLPRPLAAREFALVSYLYACAGRVCSRQELGDAVWGPDRWDPDMLYQLVRRVKAKLEPDPVRPRYLHNVPGFGYRLTP